VAGLYIAPDPIAGFNGWVPGKGKGWEGEEGKKGGWTPLIFQNVAAPRQTLIINFKYETEFDMNHFSNVVL